MNRRFALIVSTVILAAALGSVWRAFRDIQELEFALRGARGEVSRFKATLAALQSAPRPRTSPKKPAVVRPGVATKAATAGLLSEEARRAHAQGVSEERKAALRTSPGLQVLFEESRRGSHREEFAALFRRLKLSAEQQGVLVSALVAWDMKSSDLEAVMRQQGLSRNDPALKAPRAEAEAALTRDAQAVLGPDALKITREYTRLQEARSYVAGYGGLFSRLGQPLTFEQIDALTNAFGDASPTEPPQPNRFTTAQWGQVAARAQSILAPGQWQIFQSTTSPGETAGPWESAANEALGRVAPADTTR